MIMWATPSNAVQSSSPALAMLLGPLKGGGFTENRSVGLGRGTSRSCSPKYREFRGVDFFVSRHATRFFLAELGINTKSSGMSGGWVVRDGPLHRRFCFCKNNKRTTTMGATQRGRDGQV